MISRASKLGVHPPISMLATIAITVMTALQTGKYVQELSWFKGDSTVNDESAKSTDAPVV